MYTISNAEKNIYIYIPISVSFQLFKTIKYNDKILYSVLFPWIYFISWDIQ